MGYWFIFCLLFANPETLKLTLNPIILDCINNQVTQKFNKGITKPVFSLKVGSLCNTIEGKKSEKFY